MKRRRLWFLGIALFCTIAASHISFAQPPAEPTELDKALLTAIQQRKAAKVKTLLEHSANPNVLDTKWSGRRTSGLFLALGVRVVQNGTVALFPVVPDPEIVSLLLQHRADLQIKDEDGSPRVEIAGWKQEKRWLVLYIQVYSTNTRVGIRLTREKRHKARLIQALKSAGVRELR